MTTVTEWIEEHGSIAGWPVRCHATGLQHPLVAHEHEENVRLLERLANLASPGTTRGRRFRASPDLAHMLVCPDDFEQSAWGVGANMVCDPALPPDSIALDP